MTLTQLAPPYPIFTDKNGDPLDAGYLYFGEANQNPETNPIQVYYDNGLTIPAAQPVRTSNGYVMRNGSPALIYADGQFSVTVRNKKNELVIYSPVGFGVVPGAPFTFGTSDRVVRDVATLLADVQFTYTFGVPNTVQVFPGDILRTLVEGFAYEVAASGATDQHVTTAGAVKLYVQKSDEGYNVKAFGAVGDGVADDTAEIQTAFRTVQAATGTLFIPPGTYRVSSTIGVDNATATDFCDDVTVIGYGATLLVAATAAMTALSLEGNNCHVYGLTVLGERTIDHTVNPSTLRSPYQFGIVVGGKLIAPRSIGNASYLRSNISVVSCKVTNVNAPITVGRASNAIVTNNLVHDYTDTGILIDDPITEITLSNNQIFNGADDCIFVRHYANSFYVNGTTNFVGRVSVTGNILGNTFGKCFGVGGLSDILVADNVMFDSWAGSINYENGGDWSNRSIDNENYMVSGNTVRNAGQYFGPSFWRTLPHPDDGTQSAFNGQIQSTRVPNAWENVSFVGNTVVNARKFGVCAKSLNYLHIRNNTFLAEDAASVAAVEVYASQDISIQGNTIIGKGINWPHCYTLSVTRGEAVLERVKIRNNVENFSVLVMDITSAEYGKIDYLNESGSGYNGTVNSNGYDTSIDRFGLVSAGPASNLQVYHAASWPLRMFNSAGDMLLQVNNSGAASGNVGIGVGGTPTNRLHVTGPGGGVSALRVDNSNVANGSVAVSLGGVGPVGSTAGNPQGWLEISVSGVNRYIPFW